jgi:hypothetical protein
MLVYASIMLLVLFSFFISTKYPHLSKVNSYLVFIYISATAGLRHGVGVDFLNYQAFIVKISNGVDTYMEPGFEAITFYSVALGFTPQFIFLLFSFFTCLFFIISINKHSIDKGMSLALFCFLPFFYLASFNQIRQFFVASLLAFSLNYIIKRKLISFLLLVFFATSFHKIAVLFIPMYWFAHRLWGIKTYCVLFVLFTVLCKFVDYLAGFIGLSPAYFVGISESSFDYRTLIFIALFGMSYLGLRRSSFKFINRREQYKSQSVVTSINMAFICILIMLSPIFINNINSSELLRLSGLYTFCLLILIPFVIEKFTKKYSLIFSIGGVLLSVSYFFITIFNNGERYKLVPYSGSLLLFN